jgi:hypothetical protein
MSDQETEKLQDIVEENILPFLQYVEAYGAKDLDLSSDLAVEIQAKYIAEIGSHPFEALKSISQNPMCKPADRIGAAKALLEYSHRKVPQKVDVGLDKTIKIDASALSALTTEELDTLQALLAKTNAQS